MGLTKKAHTVRLLNFEEELLAELSIKKNIPEEEILLEYIRAGLKREKYKELDNVASYSQREKQAKEELFSERKEALYHKRPSAKKEEERNTLPQQREIDPPEPRSLDEQFVELATTFALLEAELEQIQAGEYYLLQGQKELKIIAIQEIGEDGILNYQVVDDASEKDRSISIKRVLDKMRGPIQAIQIQGLQDGIEVATA